MAGGHRSGVLRALHGPRPGDGRTGVGSTYAWRDGDLNITDPEQVILESDPYRRFAFTFHTFTSDLTTIGLSEDVIDAGGCRAQVEGDVRHRAG